MTTIFQVAKRAGVSPTTVSHVVNKTRFVSQELTARVQTAMQELGYQPNALARSLRRGETRTLGMVLPDSANPFFAEIGRVIEMEAFQAGYSMVLCNSEDDAEKETLYAHVLMEKQVDGIILASTGAWSDMAQNLLRQGVPLALIDRPLPEVEADTVLTDNRIGGAQAAQQFVQMGRRDIACITGPRYLASSNERVIGFVGTLESLGIPGASVRLEQGDFHPESGYQAGLRLLREPGAAPSAVFCCNDLMAMGLCRAAAELGLRVPQDLAVIGFDDIELSRYFNPSLSTVMQPKADIGRAAVSMLLERIKDPSIPPRLQVFEPKLLIRKSCEM